MFATVDDLTHAVLSGQRVCWRNDNYEVVHTWDFLIRCTLNGSTVGLFTLGNDGNEKLSGDLEDFYLSKQGAAQ